MCACSCTLVQCLGKFRSREVITQVNCKLLTTGKLYETPGRGFSQKTNLGVAEAFLDPQNIHVPL